MNENFDQTGQPEASSTPSIASVAAASEAFSFSGRGGEYFRIWIVNLLLSIVTLGIYSAWAKVRRLNYFYNNTTVAGASFEYHGKPIAILKGRFIAAALLIGYNVAFEFNQIVGLVFMALLALATPWLVWRSLQFKLHNSSYRGVRFGFAGAAKEAYKVYLLLPLLTLFTFYLLAPFTHQRMKRFQHSQSRFGTTSFSFDGSVGKFYKTYFIAFGIYLIGLIAIVAGFSSTILAIFSAGGGLDAASASVITFFVLAIYVWTFLLYPLFLTLIQNLIWNHTKLGDHVFSSKMRWGRVVFITITNIIAIIVTLGLFIPFAQIRMMRYRIESMALHPAGDLNNFVAANEASGSVTSEGISDLFDFDLSL